MRCWFIVALLLAVLLAACSRKADPPPAPKPQPEPTAPPSARFAPASVLDRLGDATSVFAFDYGRVRGNRGIVRDLIPACKGVFATVGVVVFAYGNGIDGYASNVPVSQAKPCITAFAPAFGGTFAQTGDHYEIIGAKIRYSLEWTGLSLHVSEAGHPMPGKLSAELRQTIDQMPEDAVLWFVNRQTSDSFAKVAWGKLTNNNTLFELTIKSRGKPEETESLFNDIVAGMRSALEERKQTWDDHWVTRTVDTLELRVPVATLLGGLPQP